MMIWVSEDTAVAVDGTTIHEAVREAAGRAPEHVALVDGASGATISYAELQRRVDRVAAWLAATGFAPGDRLALWCPNVPPFAAFSLAAMQLGGSVTAMNPVSTPEEVARQLADSDAGTVVTIPSLVEAAIDAGARRVIVLGDLDTPRDVVTAREVLSTEGPAPRPAVDADAVALLPYSSGTTGLPKGVLLSHRNLVTASRQIVETLRLTRADVTLAAAPFFHILGFTAELLAPLSVGATVVTLERFDFHTFLDLLERHAVTYVAVPPPAAALLASDLGVGERELGRLRFIGCGGAALGAEVQQRLAARLPWCRIGQGWGLTETSGAITIPRADEGSRPGTVGRLLPNTELRVVDLATGRELGEEEDGELRVRGPQVMAGYLGNPVATTEAFDEEGWLRTGDLGHVERDGSVVIVDRIKELIKVNAYQVAPAELEALLRRHPAVADAAVIGRPDERTGEAPVAFVLLRPGAHADAVDIRSWAAERLAPYKRLADVQFVDAIPRNPSGKILRRLLVDAAERRRHDVRV